MANAIDGLGTINVTQLVSSLMSVEGGQQKLLTSKRTAEQSALTSLQTLNTQVKGIRTAAEAMIGSVLAPTPWTSRSVTSSSASVAATATPGAAPGSFAFDVESLAATHRVMTGTAVAGSTPLVNGPITITAADGTSSTIELSPTTTIAELVAAINASGPTLFKAAAVQVSPGMYRLALNATEPGAAGAFTVSGLDPALGAPTVVSQGADARLRIGPGPDDVITSRGNTFTDVLPGLSFTVSKVEQGVTLDVGSNTSAMTAQVKSLVDAVNTALGTVATSTAFDATTKKGGPLLGERLPTAVAGSLTGAALAGGSLAAYGVQLDRNGKLVLDADKLQKALASDPVATTAAMTQFATRLGQVAKSATDFGTGSITGAVQARQSRISAISSSIGEWDARLARKKEQLTRQFSALNTQLSTMNNQASWLSTQLSQLSGSSSSKK